MAAESGLPLLKKKQNKSRVMRNTPNVHLFAAAAVVASAALWADFLNFHAAFRAFVHGVFLQT